jgi:phosphomannomutase
LEKKHDDELDELAKNSDKKIVEFQKISEETIKKEKMNLDHYIRSLKSELNKVTEKNKKIVYDNKHKI